MDFARAFIAEATPTALNLPAQGCEERATLGFVFSKVPILKGLKPIFWPHELQSFQDWRRVAMNPG